MEYQINLKQLREELKSDRDRDFYHEIFETQGERYLHEHVIQKFASGIPVYIGDVDFSAFDEDDIVDLIDNKGREIDDLLCAFERIVNGFVKSKPLIAKKRCFF